MVVVVVAELTFRTFFIGFDSDFTFESDSNFNLDLFFFQKEINIDELIHEITQNHNSGAIKTYFVRDP